MIASILVSILCAHLLCFSVMFLLISRRLSGNRMGVDYFAAGNLLLAAAYVLQLIEGGPTWSLMSATNHTLTLAAPIAYWLGALRFFGYPAPLWRPLLGFAAVYGAAQVLAEWSMGPTARYAMLAATAALLFFATAASAIYGIRHFAKDLKGEMVFFAIMIGGIGILNVIKFLKIMNGGLDALQMDNHFQMVFYIYMSTLATVMPPAIIWLVFIRLTNDLRQMAARDPMTDLLNRRGLLEALQLYFNTRSAEPAYLLIMDIDHFKAINDTHGHHIGDDVIRQIAERLRTTVRRGDLTARIGGEEFVAICLETDANGVINLAERLRTNIENQVIIATGVVHQLRCTVTIGISSRFHDADSLDEALQQADAALYQGKAAGRNRIEVADVARSQAA